MMVRRPHGRLTFPRSDVISLTRSGRRLCVEFGHVQGMLQPATPMSMSTPAGMLAAFGLTVEIVDIDGRLYGNLTDAPATRQRLVEVPPWPLLSVPVGVSH